MHLQYPCIYRKHSSRTALQSGKEGRKIQEEELQNDPQLGTNAHLTGFFENAVMNSIDEKSDRFEHSRYESAKRAHGLNTTKRPLPPEALKLILQRGAASGNYDT